LQMQLAFANSGGASPGEPLEQRPSRGFGPAGAFFNEKCGLANRPTHNPVNRTGLDWSDFF
jgi:hypothetical protein